MGTQSCVRGGSSSFCFEANKLHHKRENIDFFRICFTWEDEQENEDEMENFKKLLRVMYMQNYSSEPNCISVADE